MLSTGAETDRGFLITADKFSDEAVFPPSGQEKNSKHAMECAVIYVGPFVCTCLYPSL